MKITKTITCSEALLAGVLAVFIGCEARAASDRFGTSKAPVSPSAQRDARAPARGPLPDPALFDGSKHPAEKRPEYGMVGEFELPGDDSQKNDRVGGQQPEQMAGGSSTQPAGKQSGQSGQQGGQGGPQPEQPKPGGGSGTEAGDKVGPIGSAGRIAGQGDPNAKAEGIQVAELKTDPEGNSQSGNPGDAGRKPQQVSIGDSAMQIKTTPNAPSVVGSQPAGQTQQMEKNIGTGGIQAKGNNSNKGSERGQVIPAGL